MDKHAEYLQTMHNIQKHETHYGFVTGRIVKTEDRKMTGLEIMDIFIVPAMQKNKFAAKLVDEFIELYRRSGVEFDFLLGTSNQKDPNKEASLKAQIDYGFRIDRYQDGKVTLLKLLQKVSPTEAVDEGTRKNELDGI